MQAADLSAARTQEIQGCVESLKSEQKSERDRAAATLLRPENRLHLGPFSQSLIKAAGNNIDSEQIAALLGRLSISEDLTNKVKEAEVTPAYVKARLRDKAAEEKVIAKFEAADGLVELRRTSDEVLYVGSEPALEAFLKRLESTKIFQDVHGNEISAVVMLLQAYGREHPEIPLFQPETYMQHANVSREEFQKDSHQAYLRRVEEFFKSKYNKVVKVDPPLLLNNQKRAVRIQRLE